jgi:hypothetical protein
MAIPPVPYLDRKQFPYQFQEWLRQLRSAAVGSGTVTSASLVMPGEFGVAGSPITTSGTFTVSKINQAANAFYAGPISGGAASPVFRAIDSADMPHTRLAKSVAGAVDVALTAAEAFNKIMEFTGVLTGNINVIVPTTVRQWTIFNNTTGAFTLTVKTSAGTGIAVGQVRRCILYSDGTNVVRVTADV